MTMMAFLLGVIFIGVTIVAHAFAILPSQDNSGGRPSSARCPGGLPGHDSPLFFIFQGATALILFLAANTSFNASEARGDPCPGRFMARQFASGVTAWRSAGESSSWRGSRSGSCSSCNGDTHALIPLYSVGVFVCFTLSQVGIGPPLAIRPRAWLALAGVVNALGGLLTFVVSWWS